MRGTKMGGVVVVAALAALGIGAAPALAQTAQGTSAREARAAGLESEAKDLSEQKHRWDYAASLYRAAANLREEGDPEAVEDLVYAARLSYYLRDHEAAMRDLVGAAQHALAGGDVIRAAHIYSDVGNREETDAGQGRQDQGPASVRVPGPEVGRLAAAHRGRS